MCVCGGGGGGGRDYSLLTFIYRSPREEDAESCRGKIIIISTVTKSFPLTFCYLCPYYFQYVLQACIVLILLSYFSGCMLLS